MKLNENKKIELIKTIINLKEIEITELEDIKKKIQQLQKEIYKLKGIPKCPKCGNEKVIRTGIRKTYKGIIQRYCCKNCDWRFIKKDLSYRMRNDKETIEKALNLRKQGKTYSQIAEILDNKVTRQSIMRWLHRFQMPKEERIIKRKMRNQYGEYERKFVINI